MQEVSGSWLPAAQPPAARLPVQPPLGTDKAGPQPPPPGRSHPEASARSAAALCRWRGRPGWQPPVSSDAARPPFLRHRPFLPALFFSPQKPLSPPRPPPSPPCSSHEGAQPGAAQYCRPYLPHGRGRRASIPPPPAPGPAAPLRPRPAAAPAPRPLRPRRSRAARRGGAANGGERSENVPAPPTPPAPPPRGTAAPPPRPPPNRRQQGRGAGLPADGAASADPRQGHLPAAGPAPPQRCATPRLLAPRRGAGRAHPALGCRCAARRRQPAERQALRRPTAGPSPGTGHRMARSAASSHGTLSSRSSVASRSYRTGANAPAPGSYRGRERESAARWRGTARTASKAASDLCVAQKSTVFMCFSGTELWLHGNLPADQIRACLICTKRLQEPVQ